MTRSRALRRERFYRDNGICQRCGTDLLPLEEALVPLAMGGADDIFNVRTLCRRCHRIETAIFMAHRLAAG